MDTDTQGLSDAEIDVVRKCLMGVQSPSDECMGIFRKYPTMFRVFSDGSVLYTTGPRVYLRDALLEVSICSLFNADALMGRIGCVYRDTHEGALQDFFPKFHRIIPVFVSTLVHHHVGPDEFEQLVADKLFKERFHGSPRG